MNCDQCHGRCCKMFFLPEFATLRMLREAGIQFSGTSDLYVALHPGLTRRGDFWYLDADVPLAQYHGRLGNRWVIDAPCKWLTAQGRCEHYDLRPPECRAMDERTAAAYFIPKGCQCDPAGWWGEDVSEVIKGVGHGDVRQHAAQVEVARATAESTVDADSVVVP